MARSDDERAQLAWEKEAVEVGKQRLIKRLRQSPGRSEAANTVIWQYFESLDSEIDRMRADRSPQGRGRPSNLEVVLRALEGLPSDTITFITLSCLLEKLARRPRTSEDSVDDYTLDSWDGWASEAQLVSDIARTLLLEQWLRTFRPKGLHWATKETRNVAEVKRRLKYLENRSESGAGPIDSPLSDFCAQLLDGASKVGILERAKKGSAKKVRLTEASLKLIEAVPPTHNLPMISRPRPWKKLRGGGYLDRTMDLVKHWDNPFVKKGLRRAKLGLVYEATNALQETPWQINKQIYEAMENMRDQNLNFPGVPTLTEVQEAKQAWLRLKAEVSKDTERNNSTMDTRDERWGRVYEAKKEYRSLELKWFVEQKLIKDRLDLSRQLLDQDKRRFFFPYQLDFRGRAYAVPECLHPLSDDMGRALLEFADSKPLGTTGPYWLAIHLANMFGGEERIDKQPFDARRAWVEKKQKAILKCADSPLTGIRLWTAAKKPWRFLAACLEWQGYTKHGSSFPSRLPIAMDGTCNGFQHLSAMLRDSKGASATNLLVGQGPNDIYLLVAEKLKKKLRQAATEGEDRARWWLKNVDIDRRFVKPGVMTTPYGAGRRTKARQFVNKLKERKVETRANKELENLGYYLVGLLDSCIFETCPAYKDVQSWLRFQVAKKLAGPTFSELLTTDLHTSLVGKAKRGDNAAAKLQRMTQKRRMRLDVVEAAATARLNEILERKLLLRELAVLFLLVRGIRLSTCNEAVAGCPPKELLVLAQYLTALARKSVTRICTTARLRKWWERRGKKGRESRQLAPSTQPICWTTPSGFPVAQAECIYPWKQVGSRLYGTYEIRDTSQPPVGVDRKKQMRGIVPQFVHSLDAAHMMMTIRSLHKEGLAHFAVVHDSFAVHACDVPQLNRVLREEFVRIYEQDVLHDFWQQQQSLVPQLKISEPPRPHSADTIQQVRSSPYFFS